MTYNVLLTALMLVGAGTGCSSDSATDSTPDESSGTAGSSATASGGSPPGSGGEVPTTQGGRTGAGGSTSTGGATSPGGGGASGGATPTGGGPVSVGGDTPTGGAAPIAGATSAGGTAPAGGAAPTGGADSLGGSFQAGGEGGTAPSGGTQATGGATNGGGLDSTGGTAGGMSTGGTGFGGAAGSPGEPGVRSRELFNDGWRFIKNDPAGTNAASLSYTSAKQWVLPTGNDFLANSGEQHQRPEGNLGDDVSYTQPNFDDSSWRELNLPHDYAIEGPYTDSVNANMGHLPATGVAWYRKTFTLPVEDAQRSIFIDFDGAMSYSMVWVNGQMVGGWPYGYASYRLDITPYVTVGADNTIAVRLDNPVPTGTAWDQGSSRWYPGAGIYRDVWLVKTDPVHVAQWGTYLRTPEVSNSSATVELDVTVDNDTEESVSVAIATEIYEVDATGNRVGNVVANIAETELSIPARGSNTASTSGGIANPRLWGPLPNQTPNLYDAVTTLTVGGVIVDAYPTRFGVRTLTYDPNQGLLVNGEHVKIQGVCNHHDLGALGAVASVRGKERQLEILAELGANAVRTAHNPEAPILYELADRLGFLIMDEAFDVWFTGKTALDHHLFFEDWHEQDLRAMIRRDRNHPSVFIWSIGNEIPQQSDAGAGPTVAGINDIAHDEDPTRPTVSGMNAANPGSAFANGLDTVGLNYQGSGVRDAAPEYPDFHSTYPNKFIVGTETVDAYSSRGIYVFPVVGPDGEPASQGGGLTSDGQVSSYDLYHADWSYVPDLEFESQDRWAYVSGDFVWTGFDHLGEPDPSSGRGARSSFCGIVDLAGFPKDRYYLYQSYWRQDLPMAHILPHWNWSGRVGQVTPVMVYTSGDEAELFLNGVSQGRKQKGPYEYRLRWDEVTYEAGELQAVAYKDGQEWATDTVETSGDEAALTLSPDRTSIAADGRDLSYVTLTVVDSEGRIVPTATNRITFSVSGSGALVATDNGNAMDRTVFSSAERNAFSGMALAIVRAQPNQPGTVTLTATSQGLTQAEAVITAQ